MPTSVQANTVQKIFTVWFIILSFIALFNFYSNLTDKGRQTALETSYAENKDRYESSIREHEQFKAELNYLRGRVDTQCQAK